jgi:hypothetical protein
MHIISFLLVKITLELEIICSNRLFSLDLVNIDKKLLLSGDNGLPVQTNINIFTAVHKFIDETCRFTN